MDITLTLKKVEALGTPWREKDDVINVEPMDAGHVSPTRQNLIHITGVPDAPLENLKRMLCIRDKVLPGIDESLRNARLWCFDTDDLPAIFKNRLEQDGEVTITWDLARSRIRKKNRRISDRGQHDKANSREITDLDITGA